MGRLGRFSLSAICPPSGQMMPRTTRVLLTMMNDDDASHRYHPSERLTMTLPVNVVKDSFNIQYLEHDRKASACMVVLLLNQGNGVRRTISSCRRLRAYVAYIVRIRTVPIYAPRTHF